MQQSSPIEILFVSHKSPPATGGMEKQSYELINGVALYLKTHAIVYDHRESLLAFFLKLNTRILKLISANPQIKIIHFNDGLIAAIASYHKGYEQIKKTATIHGLDIVYPLAYFQKKIIPRFNTYDRIFAVSDATAQAACDRGIKAEKIQVIVNGVDSTEHRVKKKIADISHKYPDIQLDKKIFVTLGRPVKRKGFSWLLQQVIPHLGTDFQLLMLGPYRTKETLTDKLINLLPPKLKTMIMLFLGYPSDQNALRKILPLYYPKAIHLGKVPFEDLQIILNESLAFLMPNITIPGDMEGFGLVCLEASTAGSLVIASALEGINSAVQHKKNGILVPAENRHVWVNVLTEVLENPEHYQQQAKIYAEYTRTTYSWDIMARTYGNAFLEIAGK
ncbi:glycosyltransferase family 4 protein [Sphingobacterium tabacisoli]|uniref:Glycosyltransferase family 4 protein n=1 Tax=Sphingobacterium tabacisoli TaxID=2044855 RepID=A0ABW5L4X9_9SPHI|nr:glycosyltransferase family 4 protein [Sphingobacterium tabacisoli]